MQSDGADFALIGFFRCNSFKHCRSNKTTQSVVQHKSVVSCGRKWTIKCITPTVAYYTRVSLLKKQNGHIVVLQLKHLQQYTHLPKIRVVSIAKKQKIL